MLGVKKCITAMSLLVFGTGLSVGNAAIISTTLGTTGWSISYDNTQVTSATFTPNAPGNINEGTLAISKMFSESGIIGINFIEDAPAAMDSFGLRFTLNETITNNLGANLNGINFTLLDTSGPYRADSILHPGIAHFHNDSISSTFFTPTGLLVGTGPTTFSLTVGSLATGSSFSLTGVGIHEWEIAGVARTFQLVQTANFVPPVTNVPEPSAMALLGIGIVGLGLSRRRKKDQM